jgi:hypothetical protein
VRSSIAGRERQALADLLVRLGPDQPTLCTGWNERVNFLSVSNFAEHVRLIKKGATIWSSLYWFDAQANMLEMLVLHKDIRCTQPDFPVEAFTKLTMDFGACWRALVHSWPAD